MHLTTLSLKYYKRTTFNLIENWGKSCQKSDKIVCFRFNKLWKMKQFLQQDLVISEIIQTLYLISILTIPSTAGPRGSSVMLPKLFRVKWKSRGGRSWENNNFLLQWRSYFCWWLSWGSCQNWKLIKSTIKLPLFVYCL